MLTIEVTTGGNIIDHFEYMPPGAMGLDMIPNDSGTVLRPALFIKTDKSMRGSFGANPQINIRVAPFALNDVYLFSLMVKIGREWYLESWLNYHADGGLGLQLFEGLANQMHIPVIILDEGTEIVAAYEVKNSLRYGFKDYLKVLDTTEPWTMGEFDMAKAMVLGTLPRLDIMWGMHPKPPSLKIGLEVTLGK
ncbi:hypothetical protein [Cohnella massiliensis]|uniref:hypothetical protein n=1 Tax=Cohnella massiliensis TaxID=1816691 RepID=UPI0009BB1EDA|nr:hypothetical protein [Cohnella massiliensis]